MEKIKLDTFSIIASKFKILFPKETSTYDNYQSKLTALLFILNLKEEYREFILSAVTDDDMKAYTGNLEVMVKLLREREASNYKITLSPLQTIFEKELPEVCNVLCGSPSDFVDIVVTLFRSRALIDIDGEQFKFIIEIIRNFDKKKKYYPNSILPTDVPNFIRTLFKIDKKLCTYSNETDRQGFFIRGKIVQPYIETLKNNLEDVLTKEEIREYKKLCLEEELGDNE